MQIKDAEMKCGELIINAPYAEIMKFLVEFKPGEYDIVKTKKKRSLDANSFYWVILDKIAKKIQVSKAEIYRNAIKEIGGTSETLCMKTEAVEKFRKSWEKNGLGWQSEAFDSKSDGCTNVIAYYGSSTFNTEQMSRLIDNAMQDCEALGIETKPQEYVDNLLEQWEGK